MLLAQDANLPEESQQLSRLSISLPPYLVVVLPNFKL